MRITLEHKAKSITIYICRVMGTTRGLIVILVNKYTQRRDDNAIDDRTQDNRVCPFFIFIL